MIIAVGCPLFCLPKANFMRDALASEGKSTASNALSCKLESVVCSEVCAFLRVVASLGLTISVAVAENSKSGAMGEFLYSASKTRLAFSSNAFCCCLTTLRFTALSIFVFFVSTAS